MLERMKGFIKERHHQVSKQRQLGERQTDLIDRQGNRQADGQTAVRDREDFSQK